MKYILSQEEYDELKIKANHFDRVYQYVLDNMETKTVDTRDGRGALWNQHSESIYRLNVKELLEKIGIPVNGITMNIDY